MRESATAPVHVCAPSAPSTTMVADVAAGLLRHGQKELPPTYFYDARGSELFDEITRLDEYYPTREERRLLEQFAPAIIATVGPRTLAELGAGTATKSRILLRELVKLGHADYRPIDVDAETLADTARAIRTEFPSLAVEPIVADMRENVNAGQARHPLLYAFLGSTIGNFDPVAATVLMRRIRDTLRPTDRLLLGVDLVKPTPVLHAAYNDARGVTAEFNLNVLRVLNRELGSNFALDQFTHRAFYDERAARIEMHLVSRREQCVHIPGVGDIFFADGESIRTEISCKYTRASVKSLLKRAGFRLREWFTSEKPLFALALAEPTA